MLFLTSYYDAAQQLKPKQKLEFYDAVLGYGLYGIEPERINNSISSLWFVVKNLIDASKEKSENASKGWSKRKALHDATSNAAIVSASMLASDNTKCTDNAVMDAATMQTHAESTVKKKPDIFSDFAGGDEELLKSLREFAQMRTRIKKPMTDRAKTMLCNKLEKFSRDDWIAILDQSIYAGWQDIYALKPEEQAVQDDYVEFPKL